MILSLTKAYVRLSNVPPVVALTKSDYDTDRLGDLRESLASSTACQTLDGFTPYRSHNLSRTAGDRALRPFSALDRMDTGMFVFCATCNRSRPRFFRNEQSRSPKSLLTWKANLISSWLWVLLILAPWFTQITKIIQRKFPDTRRPPHSLAASFHLELSPAPKLKFCSRSRQPVYAFLVSFEQ